MLISPYCPHAPCRLPSALLNTSSTEARGAGRRVAAPLKITSCMLSPRSCLAEASPNTQRTASITLDLPQPLGPITATSWPGTWMVVGSVKDLKPASLMWVRRMKNNEKAECRILKERRRSRLPEKGYLKQE